MRLKSVELAGFKSFPDKTVLTFDAGLTAVLGPNGCGKSNIIDAIKWVLGEKSAKNLRGEEMLDVIFSGCSSRAQSNMAQVKLIFDNTDQSLPLPYNEVCIERRLYRSKESVYFINGTRCRMKDIRDLFLDTGVGSSAYSVIEQGRVEALLHAKPADRRAVFEEAAGIAKFKVQRKEILSRLDRSGQILLRVNDRVEEKEKQIRKVAAQAANARRHRKLAEERDAVRTRLYKRQFAAQTVLVRELAKRRGALENDLDREEKTLAALNAEFSRISERETELTTRRDSVLEAASMTQEELGAAQIEQANARNRLESLAAEINRGNERRVELASRVEKLAAQETEAHTLFAEAKRIADALEIRFAAQDGDRQRLLRDAAGAETAVTELRGKIFDANNRRQTLTGDAARLEAAEQNAARRLEEIDARLSRLAAEEEEAGNIVAGLERRYADAAASFGSSSDKLSAIRENVRGLRQSADALLREERACESERAAKASRKATLEDLENSFAGAFEGVKNILTAARDNPRDLGGVVGMAVDLMTVPQDLSLAVETILGGQAQDVVVETSRDAQDAIEHLKRNRLGRATFLPLDRIQPRRRLTNSFRNIPGVIGEAVDLVGYDGRHRAVMEYLLAGILIVDNLGLARDLAGREARGVKIVTLEGDVVNPSGAMTGGHGKQTRAGLVQRKAELDALANEVADCGRRLAEKAKRRAEAAETAERLNAEAQELERALAEAGRSEAGLKQNLAGRKADFERLSRDRAAAAAERETLAGGGRQSDLRELKSALAECERLMTSLESEVAAKTEIQRATRERIDTLGQDFAQLSGERSGALARVRELETRIAEFAAEALSCRGELARPGMTNQEAEAEISSLRARLAQLDIREEELLKIRDERRSTVSELSDSLSGCRAAIDALRQREREAQAQAARLREGIAVVDRQNTECSMRMENIREKAREELQLDDAALVPRDAPAEGAIEVSEDGGMAAATVAVGAAVPADDKPEWFDLSDAELQKRIDEISGKLRNIGSVNPEAIDELAELEAGAEFLRSHKEEMDEAITSMRAAIDRLNAESSARFTETFNTVRASFQQMFSRLFRGGKADLFLEEVTDPDADPLDAGIDIHAQPPGKEPKNISLLSGGEKALCAVALLFALFRHKPSPFCILDEVDGPLDESNIDLFMNQVRDFSDGTQFIIITHSQRTMSMMDSIWGVTQQDAGISKVTSLSFNAMDNLSRGEPRGEKARLEPLPLATSTSA